VDAAYGAIRVLEDVTLDVKSGETVVLLGTNGNGKSTLIKCIMGMVRPSAGKVIAEIDGVRHDLSMLTTEQIVELGIALVPEGRRLFPKLTVEENLLLGAYRATARAQMKQNLDFCLECFPFCASARQLAGSMSGGEQQMLALARALMLAPKILLVDEPSVGLAPILVSRTIDKIKELKDRHQAHGANGGQNFNQAIRIADRGYVIVHGKIAFKGDSAQELNNNDLIRKFYLGYKHRSSEWSQKLRRTEGHPRGAFFNLPAVEVDYRAFSNGRSRCRSSAAQASTPSACPCP
jgi:branched-chain amino acid transport system ATP-binding protein